MFPEADAAPECPPDRPAVLPVGAAPMPPRRLSSRELFAGAREVEIEHGGMLYRLRQTSLGKLILTK